MAGGMQCAAIAIQKYARAFMIRNRFLKLRRGVIKLQAVVRGLIVRKKVKRMRLSAMRIQRKYRAHHSTRREREDLINFKKAARVIQQEWRRWKFRQGIE